MSENTWEKFSKEAPENYILTGNVDYSSEKGIQDFFDSGERFTKETQEYVSDMLPAKDRALEIGCGIGRLTLPHSKIFSEVIAVDISSTMLELLNQNAVRRNQNNIRTFLPSQDWDAYSFDYVYSFLVFQHIDNYDIIKNYIGRISMALKTGGIAQLQFDTRKPGILYQIRNIMPDFLVPSSQRKGIRRIRRSPNKLKNLFTANKLKILDEKFQSSEKHFFVLQKYLGEN